MPQYFHFLLFLWKTEMFIYYDFRLMLNFDPVLQLEYVKKPLTLLNPIY